MDVLIVAMASLLAGLVDSIVGGGGLVLIPALFSIYPGAAPATLLGTNKVGSIAGTGFAALRYARRVTMRWPVILPAALAALIGSFFGAWAVTVIDPAFLRRALPFILLGVLLYTLARKDLGRTGGPRHALRAEIAIACLIGAGIGAYDGFFGPGTGSFFIFLFVRFLGYDFLSASAAAKVLNVATGAAAIVLFTLKGYIWWRVGFVLAIANVFGSLIGTQLALQRGAGFVRIVFIVVVGALILKTGWDAWPK